MLPTHWSRWIRHCGCFSSRPLGSVRLWLRGTTNDSECSTDAGESVLKLRCTHATASLRKTVPTPYGCSQLYCELEPQSVALHAYSIFLLPRTMAAFKPAGIHTYVFELPDYHKRHLDKILSRRMSEHEPLESGCPRVVLQYQMASKVGICNPVGIASSDAYRGRLAFSIAQGRLCTPSQLPYCVILFIMLTRDLRHTPGYSSFCLWDFVSKRNSSGSLINI